MKRKRASLVTKNELMREMLQVCVQNRLLFRAEDYQAKRFTPIEELPWLEETVFTGWFKDVPFLVCFVRQIFINPDGSTGILYLACSDTTLTRGQILTTYQRPAPFQGKRWPVEGFHKSLKQNAALGKSPVRRVLTQNNHVFAVLYAVFKLECLKMKQRLSHFALRAYLYLKAICIAFDEVQTLKAA
ncbi:MAG: hypothetical protein WCA79_05885 [Anaerolineales bacterium]